MGVSLRARCDGKVYTPAYTHSRIEAASHGPRQGSSVELAIGQEHDPGERHEVAEPLQASTGFAVALGAGSGTICSSTPFEWTGGWTSSQRARACPSRPTCSAPDGVQLDVPRSEREQLMKMCWTCVRASVQDEARRIAQPRLEYPSPCPCLPRRHRWTDLLERSDGQTSCTVV